MKKYLYDAYKEYCIRNDLDIDQQQTFSKKLQTERVQLTEYRPQGKKDNKNRPTCWRGIRHMGSEEINHYIGTGVENKEVLNVFEDE